MTRIKHYFISGAIWIGFAYLLGSNSGIAASHSPAAIQSFERVEQFLRSRAALENPTCPRIGQVCRKVRRPCDPSFYQRDYKPDYIYLTQEFYLSLEPAHRLWYGAGLDAEVSEEQIQASDSLIQELHYALLGGAPSRLTELIPEFQAFLQIDLKVKRELRSQSLTNQVVPVSIASVGFLCASIPPPALGLSCCGSAVGAGFLCGLYNFPRELFCPALVNLTEASRAEAVSLLPCPTSPAAVCWPSPSEILARGAAASQLKVKLDEIAVPGVIEAPFLLMILAHLYHQTGFDVALDAHSEVDPIWVNDGALTGSARDLNAVLLGSSSKTSLEELPEADSPPMSLVESDSCPICLEPSTPRLGALRATLCRHKFHVGCLRKWMENKECLPKCPVCRARIH